MSQRVQTGGLQVAEGLYNFITDEAIPGTGLSSDTFWAAMDSIIHDLAPRNRELLAKRDHIQAQIDQWHLDRKGQAFDLNAYKAFLTEIDYLLPEGDDFVAETTDVDPEMATMAGPQLVVPVMNARFALNAANARWGSLYDALYGTDVISNDNGQEATDGYNPTRGAAVVAYAKAFLDEHFALASGSYNDVTGFKVVDGKLEVVQGDSSTALQDTSKFVGFVGDAEHSTGVLLKNNGLHAEIQIDSNHPVGKDDPAHI
jgi:malate synthase